MKVPPTNTPMLATKMLIATPKSPITQPIIPVITGENIIKDKITMQIFKMVFTLNCELLFLEFWLLKLFELECEFCVLLKLEL